MSQHDRKSRLASKPEALALEGRRLLTTTALVRSPFSTPLETLASLRASGFATPITIQSAPAGRSAATSARLMENFTIISRPTAAPATQVVKPVTIVGNPAIASSARSLLVKNSNGNLTVSSAISSPEAIQSLKVEGTTTPTTRSSNLVEAGRPTAAISISPVRITANPNLIPSYSVPTSLI